MIKYIIFIIFAICGSLMIKSCSVVPEYVKSSKQFKEGKFRNITPEPKGNRFLKIMRVIFLEKWGKWPKWIDNKKYLKPRLSKNDVVMTFIGHATFLVKTHDMNILFDPMFAKRASPVKWAGPKRKRHPGIFLKDLPKIDIILISHNHYDHMDIESLKALIKKFNPKIFVPIGDKWWLKRKGIENVIELDWWQNRSLDNGVKVHFVPGQHFSGRGIFDRDKSLWGGFVIEHPKITLYHAGDTGYSHHFKEIGNRFQIDVAMLPIGDYRPKWSFEYFHMNPIQAIKAHKDLKAKQSFSMHSETFSLSPVNYMEAENLLLKQLSKEKNMNPFTILDVGQSMKFQK